MKRIGAFLQPHRVSKAVAALHALPRFPGFTLLDARGQGHGRGAAHTGNEGDGIVAVTDVRDALRIRDTDPREEEAQ